MAGEMKATPRNKMQGLLADGFGGVSDFLSKPFGYDNPPGAILAEILGLPALSRTLDRMSYGEPLTTGKGMTMRLRPDTEEAALSAPGLLGPVAQFTKGMPVGLSIKMVGPDTVTQFPKRMSATNKAVRGGGSIPAATSSDFADIFRASQEAVKNGEVGTLQEAMKLKPNEVKQRREIANAALSTPLEKWAPPPHSLFDRSFMDSIPNQGGVPGVQQADLARYTPARKDLGYVESLLDPKNLEIVKKGTLRGLNATNGGFYKSYQGMRNALKEYGHTDKEFEKGIAATSFSSAKNSVALENSIGSLLMNLERQGIPLTEENINAAKAAFKDRYGQGLSLMPIHYQSFDNYLKSGLPSGKDQTQKMTSFLLNKLGNMRPYTLDTHEASGLYYGTPHAPYFWTNGGMDKTEYGLAEALVQKHVADKLGIDPAIAQEGRWFGMGDLTGLKTGGGDWLDNYERQAAWSARELGKDMSREGLRRYAVDAFVGKEPLLPWWKKADIPDLRPKLGP